MNKPARQISRLIEAINAKEQVIEERDREIKRLSERLARSEEQARLDDAARRQLEARCDALDEANRKMAKYSDVIGEALAGLQEEVTQAQGKLRETEERLLGDIGELLERAAGYGDKPHQLFSHIDQMAARHATSPELRASIFTAMAAAYGETADLRKIAEVARLEVEAQREALTKILDGVRARMRRRELEAEQAILNRRTVAGALPSRNRG